MNELTPPGSAPVVLACRDLRKRFGDRHAVDGVSFSVHAGEVYGLVGPNGAGKTTTIRMVCGILSPDSGAVLVEGQSVTGPRSRRARASLGYVPQGLALFPDLTLLENLRFWTRLYGMSRRESRKRMAGVLELTGLTARAGDRVAECSGGMQRRLNMAVALLHRPRLLVLDEPTVGVDPQSRRALLDTLGHLRDQGTAVLYTSHYMEEVERLCDRVGVLDGGRLVTEGPPGDLLAVHAGTDDLEALFLELTGTGLRD